MGATADKPLEEDPEARAAALARRKESVAASWQAALRDGAAAAPKDGPSKAKVASRMTNWAWVLGFDNQFQQGLGYGLKAFLVDNLLGRLPRSTI